MGNSTTPAAPEKAAVLKAARKYKAKQGAKLPLTIHPSSTYGRWCKKVRGRVWYFGPVDPTGKDYGSKAALKLYNRQREDLEAGREPRVEVAGATVKDLCNKFLVAKDAALAAGELAPITRKTYQRTTDVLVRFFGRGRSLETIKPEDFITLKSKLAKTLGAESLAAEVQRIRTIFRFAKAYKLVADVEFGEFKRPSQRVRRLARQGNGRRTFTRDEVLAMLDHADVQFRAMIMLAVNTGIGSADVGRLPIAAVDLDVGWLDFPRGKTAVERRAPLWPETVLAIRAWLAIRPAPPAKLTHLMFIRPNMKSWHNATSSGRIPREMSRLMDRIDQTRAEEAEKAGRTPPEAIRRAGIGYYTLRRTFATAGDGARDPRALQYLMGHSPASTDITAVYLDPPNDARLRAVVEHVRAWLYGAEGIE